MALIVMMVLTTLVVIGVAWWVFVRLMLPAIVRVIRREWTHP